MTVESRFRAMGCNAHVIVVGGGHDAVDRAAARIAELESRWSRFVDTSEVSALNRSAGMPVRVSDDTLRLISCAVEGIELSGGSFDPMILGAVLDSGYDRSFELLGESRSTHATSTLLRTGGAIEIDGDVVCLPPDAGFDPGGIGKGLAGDLVASEALDAGARGICINLGGDVRVAGEGPDGDGWTIAIQHPWTAEPIALVGLTDGAIATSTTLLRTWHVDGDRRHHIIDPATGAPSDTDLTLAAVVSSRGWTSEILAKSVLLRGSAHPFDLLGGTAAEAVAVDDRGRVQATSGFAAFSGGEPLPAHVHPSRKDRT